MTQDANATTETPLQTPQQQPAGGAPQPSDQPATTGPDYVTREEFDSRVGKLEQREDDALTVEAPQPDTEVTAATAAAVGQPEPIRAEGDNPPEGSVDPHARSDGTGLGTEGNEPVKSEHKGFFRGF